MDRKTGAAVRSPHRTAALLCRGGAADAGACRHGPEPGRKIGKNMKIRGFVQNGIGNFVQKDGAEKAGASWTKRVGGSIIQKVERFRFHGIERTFPHPSGKKNEGGET